MGGGGRGRRKGGRGDLLSVRSHVAQRHLTLSPPPPVDLRAWESDDEVNTAYVKKLVALATTMHITHRTVGTMIYFGLIANGHYGSGDKDQAISFRAHLDQEYHATAAACPFRTLVFHSAT